MFPCAHVPERPIKHIRSFFFFTKLCGSSIISFVCVRDQHEPISFQRVGVMRINSALEWGVGATGRTCFLRPSQASPFLWAPVAEINARYDCYLSPQGCSPLSGATSGLFDEYVALISFNLCVSFRQSPPVCPPGAIWRFPRVCISE